MIITLKMLEKAQACADQRKLFGETFGDQVEVTEENCAKAVAAGLSFEWVARNLLSPVQQAEYQRITGAARAECKRITGAAQAEYRRITGAAQAEYRRITAAAQAEYERTRDAAWAEYARITGAALAEYQRLRGAAFFAASQL